MRILILAAMAALCLSGCMDVKEEVNITASGSGTFETHADMRRGLAMLKMIPPAANLPFDKDVDYTSTLRVVPDSFSTHLVFAPMDSTLTFDTKAYISDLSKVQKMRETMMRQMEGFQYMLGRKDTGQKRPDLTRLMRLVETSWTPHEIKRTFDQALLDSLKACGAAAGGHGAGAPRKDTGAMPFAMPPAAMGGNYTLIVHVPSPVSHVEGDPYTLSADHKTVRFERKFMDIFKDPKTLAFTIDY